MNITQETYDNIVLQQLREIWTRYGSLDEIWFDGGSVQSYVQRFFLIFFCPIVTLNR